MVAHSRKKFLFIQLLLLFALICIWEVLGRTSAAVSFAISTPLTVLVELKQLIVVENFLTHFATTAGEAVLGIILGTSIGTSLALCLWYSKLAAVTARPLIIILGALPIFALAPLMTFWFGSGISMKITLATFSTLQIAFNQANNSVRMVSKGYDDVLRGMNASRSQVFFKVIVPGTYDWVLSSMRLNVGAGLLGAFIGEFIAGDRGLGYLILNAVGLHDVPRSLAVGVGIILLALILDRAARYVERRRHRLVQRLCVPKLLQHH